MVDIKKEPVTKYEDIYGVKAFEPNSVVLLQTGGPGNAALRDAAILMKEAASHRLSDIDRRVVRSIQYGRFRGDPGLVQELCGFLTERYRSPVDSDDIFITNGSSSGIWELLTRFFRCGDTVFMEDPTYKLLWPYLESSEFKVVGIPMDEEGMMVDILETKLANLDVKSTSKRHPFNAAVYVMPVCHNPTTTTMSQGRQKQLVELSRKHNLLVMADDCYNLLCYADGETDDPTRAKSPTRIFAYDDKSDPDYKGNVISIGTFSKILAPGLRLGWFEMAPKLQNIFCDSFLMYSGGGKNPFLGGILAAGLELGLIQKHLAKMKVIYAERMRHVHGIITNSLSKYGVQCTLPNAGIFLWIILPDTIEAQDVLELSKDEVTVLPGQKCSLSGSHKNCLRISISFYDADVLYPAVQKLCKFVIQAIQKTGAG